MCSHKTRRQHFGAEANPRLTIKPNRVEEFASTLFLLANNNKRDKRVCQKELWTYHFDHISSTKGDSIDLSGHSHLD